MERSLFALAQAKRAALEVLQRLLLAECRREKMDAACFREMLRLRYSRP